MRHRSNLHHWPEVKREETKGKKRETELDLWRRKERTESDSLNEEEIVSSSFISYFDL